MTLRFANIDMKHGDLCSCSTCGAPGKLDTSSSREFSFEDSIWFVADETTECYDCHLK